MVWRGGNGETAKHICYNSEYIRNIRLAAKELGYTSKLVSITPTANGQGLIRFGGIGHAVFVLMKGTDVAFTMPEWMPKTT